MPRGKDDFEYREKSSLAHVRKGVWDTSLDAYMEELTPFGWQLESDSGYLIEYPTYHEEGIEVTEYYKDGVYVGKDEKPYYHVHESDTPTINERNIVLKRNKNLPNYDILAMCDEYYFNADYYINPRLWTSFPLALLLTIPSAAILIFFTFLFGENGTTPIIDPQSLGVGAGIAAGVVETLLSIVFIFGVVALLVRIFSFRKVSRKESKAAKQATQDYFLKHYNVLVKSPKQLRKIAVELAESSWQ